jgi:hypothetical protein
MPALQRLRLPLLCCLGAFGLFTGCDLKRIAASQTADVIKASMPAFNREYDFELARAALPSNLKLIEGLLEVLPDDPRLLHTASEAFGSYAFGFVEDHAEAAEAKNPERAAELRAQARELYLRAMTYAVRWAAADFPSLPAAMNGDAAGVGRAIASATREQMPPLFWIAYNLGQAVNAGKEVAPLIAQLPKAEIIMRKVLQLDENYYHASPHIFFGAYYASRPRALGGDPVKAKEHFDKAMALTGGKFLPVQLFYARQYAVQIQDRALFEQLLRQVMGASINLDPDNRLASVIAKRRALRYLKRAEDLF